MSKRSERRKRRKQEKEQEQTRATNGSAVKQTVSEASTPSEARHERDSPSSQTQERRDSSSPQTQERRDSSNPQTQERRDSSNPQTQERRDSELENRTETRSDSQPSQTRSKSAPRRRVATAMRKAWSEDNGDREISGMFIGAFFLFNGLMWILGLSLVCFVFSQIVGDGARTFLSGSLIVSYGCSIIGIIIFIIGVLGCCGGILRHFGVILVYVILTTALFITETGIAIYLIVTLNGSVDEVVSSLWKELSDELKIVLQHQFSCCGLSSYVDEYATVTEALDEASCAFNETAIYDGCQVPLVAWVSSNLYIIGAIVGCLVIIQMIATFLSCAFAGKLADEDGTEENDVLESEPYSQRSSREETRSRPTSRLRSNAVSPATEEPNVPIEPPLVVVPVQSSESPIMTRSTRGGNALEGAALGAAAASKFQHWKSAIGKSTVSGSGSEQELKDLSDHDSVDAQPTLVRTNAGNSRSTAPVSLSGLLVSVTAAKAWNKKPVERIEDVPVEQLLDEGYNTEYEAKDRSLAQRVMGRFVNWLKKGVTQGHRRPRICEIDTDWEQGITSDEK